MKQDVPYSGFAAVPADYECPDGQLAVAINCVPENNALQPVLPPRQVKKLSVGTSDRFSFIHKTSTFTHYIIYTATAQILYLDSEESSSALPVGGNNIHVYGLTHFDAIGNMLLAFAKSAIYYFLWKDNSYIYLGNQLPEISLSFGLVGHPRLYSVSDNGNKKFEVKPTDFDWSKSNWNDHVELEDRILGEITSQIMAKVNKFVAEQTVNKGRFCFPFFVRYALRLFDGSLTRQSPPVLMLPSTGNGVCVTHEQIVSDDRIKGLKCDIFLMAADLDCSINMPDYATNNISNWSDIIRSIDIFISQPLYPYNQGGRISDIYTYAPYNDVFAGRMPDAPGGSGYILNNKDVKEDTIICRDGDDIGSLVGNYLEFSHHDIARLYFSKEHKTQLSTSVRLPEITDRTNINQPDKVSNYYLLHSIPFDSIYAYIDERSRHIVEIPDDYLRSLTSRETLPDDYLSHDRLSASSSQVFNSRLNLSGAERHLFRGFDPTTLFPHLTGFISYITPENANGSIIECTVTTKPNEALTIDTYIKDNAGTYKVSSSSKYYPWFSDKILQSAGGNPTANYGIVSSGAWLYYPNTKATHMCISTATGGSYVIKLEPHDFLNGAYAFLGHNHVRYGSSNPYGLPVVSNDTDIISEPNKIYTSEVNNPFFFPVGNINTVGTGRILGIATAARALSQGQFGQFPLYAFTTEGVWAMEVSTTGTYAAKQPITRDVVLTDSQGKANSITQIDSAVLFATDRGIMLIAGSQTRCLSEQLNSEFPFSALDLPGFAKLHGMIHEGPDTCLPTLPFTEFLKNCQMIYDYIHQRIIVYNPAVTYAYVYSMKSRQWGMTFSDIISHLNSYPEALAVDRDNNIVNFSVLPDEDVLKEYCAKPYILYVTRPLKLSDGNIHKTIDNIIQRGNFARGHVATVLYGSRDLFNWHLVWSSRDHFMRGFSGTPYKYFRIAGVANLDPKENIIGASVQFTPRLTNQPR